MTDKWRIRVILSLKLARWRAARHDARMIEELTRDDKLRLIRFVCSFAWADLSVDENERQFVRELVGRIGLDEEAHALAMKWLEHPPTEEELDPYSVPDAHKKLLLEFALEMVAADGRVDRMEVENFMIFESMMTGDGEDPIVDGLSVE